MNLVNKITLIKIVCFKVMGTIAVFQRGNTPYQRGNATKTDPAYFPADVAHCQGQENTQFLKMITGCCVAVAELIFLRVFKIMTVQTLYNIEKNLSESKFLILIKV